MVRCTDEFLSTYPHFDKAKIGTYLRPMIINNNYVQGHQV